MRRREGMKRSFEHEMPSIEVLRAGEAAAWDRFFRRFDATIRGIVAWPKWRFDEHTREDVVQTIRVGVVDAIGRLQSASSLEAFVRTICVHRCIDALRRALREKARLEPLGFWTEEGEWSDRDLEAGEAFDPVTQVQREERAALLRAALGRLDEQSRENLLLFYVEGLSYKEMADRQGVAVNTVGSRLSRSLERLRETLGEIRSAL